MSIEALGLHEDEIRETMNDCQSLLDTLQIPYTVKNELDDRVQDYLEKYGDWSNITPSIQEAYYETTKDIVEKECPALEMYYGVGNKHSGISLLHRGAERSVEDDFGVFTTGTSVKYTGEGKNRLIEKIGEVLERPYADAENPALQEKVSLMVTNVDTKQQAIFAISTDDFIIQFSDSFKNTSLSVEDYVDGWLQSETQHFVLDFSKNEPVLLLDNENDNVAMAVPVAQIPEESRQIIYSEMVLLIEGKTEAEKALLGNAVNYFTALEDFQAKTAQLAADILEFQLSYGETFPLEYDAPDETESGEQFKARIIKDYTAKLETEEGRQSFDARFSYISEITNHNGLEDEEKAADAIISRISELSPAKYEPEKSVPSEGKDTPALLAERISKTDCLSELVDFYGGKEGLKEHIRDNPELFMKNYIDFINHEDFKATEQQELDVTEIRDGVADYQTEMKIKNEIGYEPVDEADIIYQLVKQALPNERHEVELPFAKIGDYTVTTAPLNDRRSSAYTVDVFKNNADGLLDMRCIVGEEAARIAPYNRAFEGTQDMLQSINFINGCYEALNEKGLSVEVSYPDEFQKIDVRLLNQSSFLDTRNVNLETEQDILDKYSLAIQRTIAPEYLDDDEFLSAVFNRAMEVSEDIEMLAETEHIAAEILLEENEMKLSIPEEGLLVDIPLTVYEATAITSTIQELKASYQHDPTIKLGEGEMISTANSNMELTEFLVIPYSGDNGSGNIFVSEDGWIGVAKDGADYEYIYGKEVGLLARAELIVAIESKTGRDFADIVAEIEEEGKKAEADFTDSTTDYSGGSKDEGKGERFPEPDKEEKTKERIVQGIMSTGAIAVEFMKDNADTITDQNELRKAAEEQIRKALETKTGRQGVIEKLDTVRCPDNADQLALITNKAQELMDDVCFLNEKAMEKAYHEIYPTASEQIAALTEMALTEQPLYSKIGDFSMDIQVHPEDDKFKLAVIRNCADRAPDEREAVAYLTISNEAVKSYGESRSEAYYDGEPEMIKGDVFVEITGAAYDSDLIYAVSEGTAQILMFDNASVDYPEAFEELDLTLDYDTTNLTKLNEGEYLLDVEGEDFDTIIDRVKTLDGGASIERTSAEKLSELQTDVIIKKDSMRLEIPEWTLSLDVPLTPVERMDLKELVTEAQNKEATKAVERKEAAKKKPAIELD